MNQYLSRLNYSIGNEDWDSDHQALNIQPTDKVLCITASGDRPLNLLIDNPKKIIATDMNPIQNYLLSLKIAAIRHLDYDRFMSFMGATPDAHRWECFNNLTQDMDDKAADHWLRHKKQITSGVLYQGAIEKWCVILAKANHFLRGSKVEQLFKFDNLEEQQQFVREKWDSKWCRKVFNFVSHPLFIKMFLNDPGLYAHTDPSIRIGTYIYDRLTNGLMHRLAKESSLLCLFLKGRVEPSAYSPYLTESGFNIIKKRVDRIEYQTTELVQLLESSPENSFDIFSISDVASYITRHNFQKLMRQMYRVAKPKARFIIREFLSRHQVPLDLQRFFRRNTALESDLEKQDSCFVYRFMIGAIEKQVPLVSKPVEAEPPLVESYTRY